MDRLGPTGKVSKKRVHLLRWTNFPGRTGWNFAWMDRALEVWETSTEIPYWWRVTTQISNRLYWTKEDIFWSIADWFNRLKTGIETIVTMIWKPDLGRRTCLLTTDFVKQICVRRYHRECRPLSRFYYIWLLYRSWSLVLMTFKTMVVVANGGT